MLEKRQFLTEVNTYYMKQQEFGSLQNRFCDTDILYACTKYDIMTNMMYIVSDNICDYDSNYISYKDRLELLKDRVKNLSDIMEEIYLYNCYNHRNGDILGAMDSTVVELCVYYSKYITELYRLCAYLRLHPDVFGLTLKNIDDIHIETEDKIPEKILGMTSSLTRIIDENIENYKKPKKSELESCISMIFKLRRFLSLSQMYMKYLAPYDHHTLDYITTIATTLILNEINEYADSYNKNNEISDKLYDYIAGQIIMDDKNKLNIYPSNKINLDEISGFCRRYDYDPNILMRRIYNFL